MWKWISSWFSQEVKDGHPRLFADRPNQFYDPGSKKLCKDFPEGFDNSNYVEVVDNPHYRPHIDLWWEKIPSDKKVEVTEKDEQELLRRHLASRIHLTREDNMVVVYVDKTPVMKVQI